MKPAPQELLKRIEELAPQGSEVIPLGWAYEDEDLTLLCSLMKRKMRG
jgi:hypothetical protein